MILDEFDENKIAILNPEMFHKKDENFPEVVIGFFTKMGMEDY